ncbi:hypothetical protein D3C85_1287850 [compost metagenome]
MLEVDERFILDQSADPSTNQLVAVAHGQAFERLAARLINVLHRGFEVGGTLFGFFDFLIVKQMALDVAGAGDNPFDRRIDLGYKRMVIQMLQDSQCLVERHADALNPRDWHIRGDGPQHHTGFGDIGLGGLV